MAHGRQSLHRVVNGIRKVAAGLRPFSESVWPGVRNDLFVAHESIYLFFAGYVEGARVLDAGCGTGYGSFLLAESGAVSVLGVDLDRKNVMYATKHLRASNLKFEVADIENLAFPPGSFDVVVASNSLEHLHSPEKFLEFVSGPLTEGGTALLAVPPIYGQADMKVHSAIRYHRSNLTVSRWLELLHGTGCLITCFSHRARSGVQPDFANHQRSVLQASDFEFVPVSPETLRSEPSITAVFLVSRAA